MTVHRYSAATFADLRRVLQAIEDAGATLLGVYQIPEAAARWSVEYRHGSPLRIESPDLPQS